jgi:TetR/AcrR family transcriptional repressor of nem operon
MKVSKEQVAENRQALLEAAARLLRAKGLAGAGVAEICREAGLTHGAFYRHFPSKDALILEACALAFAWSPLDLQRGRGRRANVAAHVASYLSPEHRDAAELGCPVAALAVDAARGDAELGEAFAAGIEHYIQAFTDLTAAEPGGADQPRAEHEAAAIQTLATLVGGLVIARATAAAKPQLSEKVLRILRRRLGGAAQAQAH